MRTALFTNLEFDLTEADARAASHPGPCDDDVAYLLTLPYIQSQLAGISDDDLKAELAEYGCWDEEELQDRQANEARIVWLAAGQIVDELYEEARG